MAELDWVEVPTGTFIQGTDDRRLAELASEYEPLGISGAWFLKECPAREVLVPRFFVTRRLVTRAEFSSAAAALGLDWRETGDGCHPVAAAIWQAVGFCEWLADRVGVQVRLLTESEWERAARGDDGREFPWGDQFELGRANTREAAIGATTPVGSFPAGASPFGLLDAAGNLDEWTLTPYAPYPSAPPDVPSSEDWALSPYVTRGGGFAHMRDAARCARRHGVYSSGPVGFRIATTAEPP